MSYTTIADVAAELGRPIPTDDPTIAQWNWWINGVENQIRAAVPDLDTRIAADPTFRGVVVHIVAAAVARVARNPEGLRSVTRSVDDGSVTKTVDSSRSAGGLYLTDDEWTQLLPLNEAFTIRLGPRC
jgi:hypothetical protein